MRVDASAASGPSERSSSSSPGTRRRYKPGETPAKEKRPSGAIDAMNEARAKGAVDVTGAAQILEAEFMARLSGTANGSNGRSSAWRDGNVMGLPEPRRQNASLGATLRMPSTELTATVNGAPEAVFVEKPIKPENEREPVTEYVAPDTSKLSGTVVPLANNTRPLDKPPFTANNAETLAPPGRSAGENTVTLEQCSSMNAPVTVDTCAREATTSSGPIAVASPKTRGAAPSGSIIKPSER
jgi:hypothetical protein